MRQDSVWKYASSISAAFSGVTPIVAWARKYGSTRPLIVSSVSFRLKPRVPGLKSLPGGMNPVMPALLGSCEEL